MMQQRSFQMLKLAKEQNSNINAKNTVGGDDAIVNTQTSHSECNNLIINGYDVMDPFSFQKEKS